LVIPTVFVSSTRVDLADCRKIFDRAMERDNLGAAAGSAVPGVGTALGGILGAAAVWLTTDKAVVEVGEYLNREAFEADMATLIDVEKARIKEELREGYGTYLSNISEHTRKKLEGLRPVDLIEESE